MPTNVEILRSIEERNFKPKRYEELELSQDRKRCLDKIMEFTDRPYLVKAKELATELGMNDSRVSYYARKLCRTSLTINPNIFELAAVYFPDDDTFKNNPLKHLRFKNRVLDILLSSDLSNVPLSVMRDRVKYIREGKETVSTTKGGAAYTQYHIAIVSVNDIPVYSKIFY